MTIRQELLLAATNGARSLGSGSSLTTHFIQGCLCADGGFCGRGRGQSSDLYYTVFGLECLLALGARLDATRLGSYLDAFGDGRKMDLVHLACLARCRANLADTLDEREKRRAIATRLEAFRTSDGAYALAKGRSSGSAYGCFLALGAFQDLGEPPPPPESLAECLDGLAIRDGAYVNERSVPIGTTPATVAAMTTLRHLGRPIDGASIDWLLARSMPGGGFAAADGAPQADLLSTAVALHALAAAGVSIEPLRRDCLEFARRLQDASGGWRGADGDEATDCEYTFHAFVALGHLLKIA